MDRSDSASYSAVYSLANINPWNLAQNYVREQFHDKLGNNYNNATEIIVPASGSRVRNADIDPR